MKAFQFTENGMDLEELINHLQSFLNQGKKGIVTKYRIETSPPIETQPDEHGFRQYVENPIKQLTVDLSLVIY